MICLTERMLPRQSPSPDIEEKYKSSPQRGKLISQENAPEELRILSGLVVDGKIKTADAFLYHAAAGEHITVYILEQTFGTFGSSSFYHEPRWLWPDIWEQNPPRYDDDRDKIVGNSHGAFMAARVADKEYGIAKRAQLVIVLADSASRIATGAAKNHSYMLRALKAIIRDVQQLELQGKAVLNMSHCRFSRLKKCS